MSADVGGGLANSVKEGVEKLAEVGAELSQGGPPATRKASLGFVDRWRREAEDAVWAVSVDGFPDCAGVDGADGWFVVGLWHGVVLVQEGRDRVQVL